MPFTILARLSAVLVLSLAGCSALSEVDSNPSIDFSLREPLPEVGSIEPQPLRIAVAAILSPEGTVESYTELAEYLGEQLGRPAQIVQRRTYAEVNALIAANEVDVAFVCTSAYVAGHDRSIMDLLVIPEIAGETVYRSALIVPASSSAMSMEDLRGASFAFTDPMSLTGRVYPTHRLLQLGESPDEFFSETIFTYGHDRAIEAVAARVVDGAAVDQLVLTNMLRSDRSLAGRIRVIEVSPDFGIPPVVVPSGTPASIRVAFEELLMGLTDHPAGLRILADLGVDRFVLGTDQAYDGARTMVYETGFGS
jgi:phosphonate transport system substrate-binding protein